MASRRLMSGWRGLGHAEGRAGTHACALGDGASASAAPPRPARPAPRLAAALLHPWGRHPAFVRLRPSSCAQRHDQYRHASAGAWSLVHPHSRLSAAWHALLLPAVATSLLLKPLVVCFAHAHLLSGVACAESRSARAAALVAFLAEALLALDILVKFRTGFCAPQHGAVAMGRRLVATRYLRTWFLPDACTACASAHLLLRAAPAAPAVPKPLLLGLHVVSLLSVYRLHELRTHLRTCLTLLGAKKHSFRLLSHTLTFFIACHYMTCLHFWFPAIIRGAKALQTDAQRPSWLAEYNTTICGEYAVHYLQSLDRTISFITGFDFKFPHTTEDQYLFLVNSWLGKALLVYAFAIALEISQMNTRSSISLERTVRELRDFVELSKMPDTLKHRLMHYFRYRLQSTFFDERKIIDSLPPQVQKDVKFYSCRSIMERLPMFQNVPRKLLEAAALAAEGRVYLRNDVVYAAGAEADGVYLVASGSLMATAPDGVELGHVPQGGCCGEAEAVRGTRRATSAVALETSEVRMPRNALASLTLPFALNAVQRIALERHCSAFLLTVFGRTSLVLLHCGDTVQHEQRLMRKCATRGGGGCAAAVRASAVDGAQSAGGAAPASGPQRSGAGSGGGDAGGAEAAVARATAAVGARPRPPRPSRPSLPSQPSRPRQPLLRLRRLSKRRSVTPEGKHRPTKGTRGGKPQALTGLEAESKCSQTLSSAKEYTKKRLQSSDACPPVCYISGEYSYDCTL